MATHKIAVLAGDGIGQEVTPEAKPLPAEMRARWNEYWGITEKKEEK